MFDVAGVPGKALAAASLGCTTLVCPGMNVSEVPSGVQLATKPVDNLKDLLVHALVKDQEGTPVTLDAALNALGKSVSMPISILLLLLLCHV